VSFSDSLPATSEASAYRVASAAQAIRYVHPAAEQKRLAMEKFENIAQSRLLRLQQSN
jgi:hypothetical protein